MVKIIKIFLYGKKNECDKGLFIFIIYVNKKMYYKYI